MILGLICTLLSLFVIAVFARIILSWFPLDPNGTMATVAGFLYVITDPIIGPLRRAIPPVRLGSVALDLSPIIVIVGARILQGVLCG